MSKLRFSFPLGILLAIVLLLALPLSAGARAQLQMGDKGTDIQNLNNKLYSLNYLPQHKGIYYDAETRDAVIAFQKWKGLTRDGVAGRQTRRKLVHAHVPSALVTKRGKYIVISKKKQLAFEMKNGKTLWAIHISTAQPGFSTPTGSWSINRKELRSWSNPYKVWLPWASYFVGGVALHGYPEVPVYPASHGCVRVPMSFAPRLYRFATMGMPVYVLN